MHYLKKADYNLDFHAENRLIYVFQPNIVKNNRNQKYARWFEFAQKTRNVDNKASDFEPYIHNSIFSEMIQRLCTQWMEPQELRQMIGDEAYFAAKKLEEEDREEDRKFQIFDQFYQIYGAQLDAERIAERWKLTMAHQAFGVEKRALLAEKAKFEQEAAKANQLLKKVEEKARKEQAVALKAEQQKAKKEQAAALKAEQQKAKKEKIALLKAEKEKQEQLLKAEKEKQEQLLEEAKLLKMKELEARIKIVQKMVDKGNSVETIAELLDMPVETVEAFIKNLSK